MDFHNLSGRLPVVYGPTFLSKLDLKLSYYNTRIQVSWYRSLEHKYWLDIPVGLPGLPVLTKPTLQID